MGLDIDFDINDYTFDDGEHRTPIDNSFWIELQDFKGLDLHIPSQRASPGWPQRLKKDFGIEEYIYYEPEIVGLPLTITREQIEEVRIRMNRHKEFLIPENISPEKILNYIKIGIIAKNSAQRLMSALGENNKVTIEPLTEWEKKVISWRADYGFLVPNNERTGTFFPVPKNIESLKYEIVREYFFHIKDKLSIEDEYFKGIILSVAQEPNSDRAIFGFRRDFVTDWPFGDWRFSNGENVYVGGAYIENELVGGRYVNVKPFVEKMNYFIKNLEEIISG